MPAVTADWLTTANCWRKNQTQEVHQTAAATCRLWMLPACLQVLTQPIPRWLTRTYKQAMWRPVSIPMLRSNHCWVQDQMSVTRHHNVPITSVTRHHDVPSPDTATSTNLSQPGHYVEGASKIVILHKHVARFHKLYEIGIKVTKTTNRMS